MKNLPELFGSLVFNDSAMKQRLPKDTYKALKRTIARGKHLNLDVANVVANAMKEWAVEKGVTHFTHWFQPMTGATAEKHDSFISPSGDGGIILEFSGRELVKGEPDASSFPSGGLRATFEARGYTAWDPTSYAFIKDNTLCIPTAFCSYSGEALDQKTPLLRSMQAINTQTMRILSLFGNSDVGRIIPTVGAEQEYFLIDKDMLERRPDLLYCGRTLFGARPPKGQELDDHYFGVLKPRVSAFMKELDTELWKLGVLSKTKHNEVAPAQHELAPIYTTINIAADHNQITMELLKTIASKHNLACLLHEKPFEGISGSGKHNNWSLITDTGVNLLEPGETPFENAQFLLILSAIIKAVDEHQDLLRISVAGAGNDHRLGSNEAPPAIVSIFLGEELTSILESLSNGSLYAEKDKEQMEIGAIVLPHFPKDKTDRNRTSPFAFTGNKFEFRMVGSSFSIANANLVINTIVADALSEFADVLEKSQNFKDDLNTLIKSTIKKHRRIISNGNNYCEQWAREALKRGLLNLKTTPDALSHYASEKNIRLFEKQKVLSAAEIRSRYEIALESYNKVIHIEGLTLSDMTKKGVIPSVISYMGELARTVKNKKAAGENLPRALEEEMLYSISTLSEKLLKEMAALDRALEKAGGLDVSLESAVFYSKTILPKMQALREVIDGLEARVAKKYWSYPTYGEILYSVH